MKRVLWCLVPLLFLVSLPAAAQQPEGEWYAVYADRVASSNLLEYEETIRELVAVFEEADVPGVPWIAISTFDFGHSYVFPGIGYDNFAEFGASWEAAVAAVGERGAAVFDSSDRLVESRDMYFIQLRPELSYLPEDVAISVDEPYRQYLQLFVHPSGVEEFEASVGTWIETYEELGIEHGWLTYQYMTGQDLPAYLMVESAASELDYHTWSAEVEERLGERGWDLWVEAIPSIRRLNQTSGWVRPDMSYGALADGE